MPKNDGTLGNKPDTMDNFTDTQELAKWRKYYIQNSFDPYAKASRAQAKRDLDSSGHTTELTKTPDRKATNYEPASVEDYAGPNVDHHPLARKNSYTTKSGSKRD